MNTIISDSNANSRLSVRIRLEHKCDHTNVVGEHESKHDRIPLEHESELKRQIRIRTNSKSNIPISHLCSYTYKAICFLAFSYMTSMSGVAQLALVKYQPAIERFLHKFDVELHNTLSAFKRYTHVSGNCAVAAASTCKCGGSKPVSVLGQ